MSRYRALFLVVFGGMLLSGASGAHAGERARPEAGKKIKVFLLGGQSNMEGRADGARLSPVDTQRLDVAQSRVQLAYNNEAMQPLNVVVPVPGIARSYKRDLIFGPELFFGIALAEAWPDEKILLIKRTQGGTSLYGCWNPEWTEEKAALMNEEKKPRLYGELIAYAKDVLSGYAEDQYELCGMLWVQGESDASNEIAAAAYGDNLQNLIRSIRHDMGSDALPFLMFQVGSGQVVEGMRRVSAEVPGVTLLPQDKDPASTDFYPIMEENNHYNNDGMRKLGERFAAEFLEEYTQH